MTRSTLLHALLGAARTARSTTQSDMIIRERLLAEMSKQPWAPTSTIEVIVRDGVIELWGTINDERQRTALRVAAENISAVKEIKDHLVWAAMMIQPEQEDAPVP